MSGWVKVPADWLDSDAAELLGADAVALTLSALAYSARHLTNGVIPGRALRRLWPAPDGTVQQLVDAGWWQARGDDWVIVDWDTFILHADEVEKRVQQNRESSERYRRHRAGDHSMCNRCSAVKRGDASGDRSRDPSGDTSRDGWVTRSPSPSPNRTVSDSEPTPKDREVRRSEDGVRDDSAGATSTRPLQWEDTVVPAAADDDDQFVDQCIHGDDQGLAREDGEFACPDCEAMAPASILDLARDNIGHLPEDIYGQVERIHPNSATVAYDLAERLYEAEIETTNRFGPKAQQDLFEALYACIYDRIHPGHLSQLMSQEVACTFEPDNSGITCARCELPGAHPRHLPQPTEESA